MIYLDVAATARPDHRALLKFREVTADLWMNPSARVYSAAAANELEAARKKVADTLHVSPTTIFFTSGSTEAANWVIQTFARYDRYIITSRLEHPCVYNTAVEMPAHGAHVRFVENDNCGRIDLVDLADKLEAYSKTHSPILVALAGANNEIGTIQPIHEIAALVHEYPDAYFFCDTTQLWAHGEIEVGDIDFACASGHKFGALRGAGFLYCKQPDFLEQFMFGGHQEDGMRPGTENLPAIAALGEMFSLTAEKQRETAEKYRAIRQRITELADGVYKINGCGSCLPNIVSITLPDCDAHKMVAALAMDDIYVGTGSACSSSGSKPSRVLTAIGLTPDEARRTIRISFDERIRPEDMDIVFEKIEQYRGLLKE